MAGQHTILKNEMENDPEVRGYAGMTEQQVMDDINTNMTPAADATNLSNTDLYESVDPVDKASLSVDELADLRELYGIDNILIGPTSKARAVLIAMFAAGTDTRTDLLALVSGNTEARWAVLGLPGAVRLGWVQTVRGTA